MFFETSEIFPPKMIRFWMLFAEMAIFWTLKCVGHCSGLTDAVFLSFVKGCNKQNMIFLWVCDLLILRRHSLLITTHLRL